MHLIWRLLRFAGGLVVGCGLVVAVMIAVGEARDDARAGAVGVHVSGSDVSAQGAAKVTIGRRAGSIVQTCSGPCDDLTIATKPHGGGQIDQIRVTNGRGGCLACVKGQGAVPTGARDEWTVGGASHLGATRVRSKAVAGG